MGEYANIKPRTFLQLLKWLANNKNVDVTVGGKHPTKVKCHSDGSYPLPYHKRIDKNIVKSFMDWLVKNGVCTKEEFDSHL